METIKLEGKWKTTDLKTGNVSVKITLKEKVEATLKDKNGKVWTGSFSTLSLVPDLRTITKLPYRIVTNFKGTSSEDPEKTESFEYNLATHRTLDGKRLGAPKVDIEFDHTKLG